MQGLETLGGQVQPGLPFDLGAQAANEGFSGMVRGIHQRLGSAAHMPPELFNAGEKTRMWQAGAAQLCFCFAVCCVASVQLFMRPAVNLSLLLRPLRLQVAMR